MDWTRLVQPRGTLPSTPEVMITVFEQYEKQNANPVYFAKNSMVRGTSLASELLESKAKGRRNCKMVEICTSTMQMTVTALKRGWKSCSPITIETGFDLLTENGRKKGFLYLQQHLPDVIIAEWPCDPFCSWVKVNAGKGPEIAQKL